MVYVYCALISFAVTLGVFAGVALLIAWALPRYGMYAMRHVLRPSAMVPPVMPPQVYKPPSSQV